jgi:hypothetical protein
LVIFYNSTLTDERKEYAAAFAMYTVQSAF